VQELCRTAAPACQWSVKRRYIAVVADCMAQGVILGDQPVGTPAKQHPLLQTRVESRKKTTSIRIIAAVVGCNGRVFFGSNNQLPRHFVGLNLFLLEPYRVSMTLSTEASMEKYNI